jgi:hypothetical protein
VIGSGEVQLGKETTVILNPEERKLGGATQPLATTG